MWLPLSSPFSLFLSYFFLDVHSGWARKYITRSNLPKWLPFSSHSLSYTLFFSFSYIFYPDISSIQVSKQIYSPLHSHSCSYSQNCTFTNKIHNKTNTQQNEYTNTHKKQTHKCTNTKCYTFDQHPCLNHRSNVCLHCLSVNQRIFHSCFLPQSANNIQSFNIFTFNLNTWVQHSLPQHTELFSFQELHLLLNSDGELLGGTSLSAL